MADGTTWEARRLHLASIAETMRETRLAFLYARALNQGHGAQIVPARDGEVAFISILVRRDGCTIGRITIDEVIGEKEEEARISVDCDAMTGLPMQADWLLENARVVRAAFEALVAS